MEISPIVLIMWGEVTFLMAGGLILLLINGLMAKRQGKKSLQGLLEKVRSEKEARQLEIRKALAAYGLKDDLLDQKVKEIYKKEVKLYQRIAMMYQNRSDQMLANMNIAVEAATKPYLDLDLSLTPAEAAPAEEQAPGEDMVPASELEAMTKLNEQLQEELAVTMETIGRMLSEYSSMFGSDEDEGLDKNKILEAFEVDESESDDSDADDDLEIVTSEDDDELEIVAEDDVDIDDLDLGDEILEVDDELLPEPEPEPDIVAGEAKAEDEVVEDVDYSVEDLDIDGLLEDVAEGDIDIGEEVQDLTDEAEEAGDQAEDQADIDKAIDDAVSDIEDIMEDAGIPDDELLEIGDEPLLDSIDLDDDVDDILSDMVDLEADFGDSREKETKADKAESLETEDIADLDIDALLEQNK